MVDLTAAGTSRDVSATEYTRPDADACFGWAEARTHGAGSAIDDELPVWMTTPGEAPHGDAYRAFLEAKIKTAPDAGLPCDESEVNPLLKPHQRACVAWAVRGGQRALFEAFGLGKTMQQLEIARLIGAKTGGDALIVAPLGVRREFLLDAAKLGVDLVFVRSDAEVLPLLAKPGRLFLTNYESVREGKLRPDWFTAVSLDEAAVLRSYGSKTFQEFLPLFAQVPYRFVATATPSPNRYKELIHYAGFLGIMDTGQALTRFFQRNSEKAGDLTLYPHKETEFWLWLNSWAVFLQRPSDLGFSDEGYDLPPLTVRYHSVQADLSAAGAEPNGQGRLIRDAALGVVQAASEKRSTLKARVARVLEIVNDGRAHPKSTILPCQLRAAEGAQPIAISSSEGVCDGQAEGKASSVQPRISEDLPEAGEDAGAVSSRPATEARSICSESSAEEEGGRLLEGSRESATGGEAERPSSGVRTDAGLLSRDAGETGSCLRDLSADMPCEKASGGRSSSRIDEGSRAAVSALQSGLGSVPGGSRHPDGGTRVSRPQQWIIWCDLNDEQRALLDCLKLAGFTVASVDGSLPLADREVLISDWIAGDYEILLSKPVLLGSGTNLQRHCHRAIFVGIGFKFADLIQAIHRLHRFQQPRPVEIDIIHAETETEVLRTLQGKWALHDELTARMSGVIREYGMNHQAAADTLKRSIDCARREVAGDGWSMAHNDCVDEVRRMDNDSVDLIVTSIPFGNHYEYSASYNDFGHTDDFAHFFAQMDHLTPELLRVVRPGRVAAVHVKDRIQFASVTGDTRPTVEPFHAETIAHFRRHGWRYMGLRFISTDVVRENNQTYRLTYKELKKDSSRMGAGSPEFLLLFFKLPTDRSNGYADVPVTKDPAAYSLARWQIDADALWRSSGDRALTPDELAAMQPGTLARMLPAWSVQDTYDHEGHVAVGEGLAARDALPKTFSVLKPGSVHPDVWTDVARMLTLNGEQTRRGLENHVCPLQFDIVDRAIRLYSNPGDLVFDPFAGIGTVPMRALKLGRRGAGVELNAAYFADAVRYCREAEAAHATPSLFALMDVDDAAPALEAAA